MHFYESHRHSRQPPAPRQHGVPCERSPERPEDGGLRDRAYQAQRAESGALRGLQRLRRAEELQDRGRLPGDL